VTSTQPPVPPTAPAFCGIVPPHILAHLAASGSHVAEAARQTLVADWRHRLARSAVPWVGEPFLAPPKGPRPEERAIYTDANTENLPGTEVRAEGGTPTGDVTADEAYDGLGATFDFYLTVYDRWSVDGKGLPLKGTVHYGRLYDNAFWNGSQMVFGDGDGSVFGRFTGALDVIGHELTHGVTQYTANLVYRGQSGALNESVSDVFGSMVKQYKLKQTADSADWLIGAGLFQPTVHGVALRSMKDPGTAYDDPTIGRDPQPATMAGYVDTPEDDGGVHINSGIPNHAFYLAATAIGGNSWEGAGRVWYDVLTSPMLPAAATFAAFGTATVQAAKRRFGPYSEEARAVSAAWHQVGVHAR
jgi:Zn-dependent metalloprotease